MVNYILILAFILSRSLHADPFTMETEMKDYESCLHSLENEAYTYRKKIPVQFIAWDRKLNWMLHGISALRDNFNLTKSLIEQTEVDANARYLIANGAAGCKDYLDDFRVRIKRFYLLFISSLVLVAILTLKVFFSMFTSFLGSRKQTTKEPINNDKSSDREKDHSLNFKENDKNPNEENKAHSPNPTDNPPDPDVSQTTNKADDKP